MRARSGCRLRIIRDERGFVCTGRDVLDLVAQQQGSWPLERDPFLLETSAPGRVRRRRRPPRLGQARGVRRGGGEHGHRVRPSVSCDAEAARGGARGMAASSSSRAPSETSTSPAARWPSPPRRSDSPAIRSTCARRRNTRGRALGFHAEKEVYCPGLKSAYEPSDHGLRSHALRIARRFHGDARARPYCDSSASERAPGCRSSARPADGGAAAREEVEDACRSRPARGDLPCGLERAAQAILAVALRRRQKRSANCSCSLVLRPMPSSLIDLHLARAEVRPRRRSTTRSSVNGSARITRSAMSRRSAPSRKTTTR